MWGDDIYDAAYAERIRSTRLTESDVQGTNLPPLPNQAENDATVLGIDANDNSIRDDVELEIFTMYPGEGKKRERVAALQYAQAKQLLFRWVIGKESMEAYLEKGSRASGCISSLSSLDKPISEMGLAIEEENELLRKLSRMDDSFEKPLKEMIFNSTSRKETSKQIYKKYMTGSTSYPDEQCDIVVPKQ